MQPILDSLPDEWERLIWDNGLKTGFHYKDGNDWRPDSFPGEVTDLSVYGRYAAIEWATHDLIYVQDDDVIVSDPQAIIVRYLLVTEFDGTHDPPYGPEDVVACNMPQEFRHDFYAEHSLVGFGAAFHRDAPARAFARMRAGIETPGLIDIDVLRETPDNIFHRCCDVVFTTLSPRVLVDVPKTNLPHATGEDRMYRQPGHQKERARMLKLALKVRDR